MIAIDKLRGIIAERGLSQRKVARHLGMTEKTFCDKMKKGVFNSDKISKMISYLNIEDPINIFLWNIYRDKKQPEGYQNYETMKTTPL